MPERARVESLRSAGWARQRSTAQGRETDLGRLGAPDFRRRGAELDPTQGERLRSFGYAE